MAPQEQAVDTAHVGAQGVDKGDQVVQPESVRLTSQENAFTKEC